MSRKSFFTKLLIAYITIVTAYTAVAVYLFFYKDNQQVRQELNQKREYFLVQASDKIDIKLGVAFNLINQLKNNEHIVNFAAGERGYYALTRAYYELRNHVDAFSDFGYKIDLMKNSSDPVITPHYSLDKARYFKELGLTEQQFAAVDANNSTSLVTLPGSAGIESVSNYDGIIRNVNTQKMKNGNVLFFIISFYEQMLLPVLSANSQEAFAIIEDNHYVTFKSSFDNNRSEQLLAYSLEQLKKPVSADYEKHTMDSFEFHLIRSTTMPNWTYLYVTPSYSIADSKNWTGTFLLLGVLATAGLIFAYIMSRRMYRPVRHLVGLFKGYDESTSTDEFAFLHETASKISTANEQLKSAMNEHRLSLRDKFMRDLLYGLIPSDQIDSLLATHQLQHLKTDLTVCVIAFSRLKELEEQYSKEAILTIKSKTSLIVQEELKVDFPCELLDLDFSKYVIIIQETDIDTIQKKLTQTMSLIEDGYTFGMIAAIGQPIASIIDIERSFSQALQILERRSAVDRTTVMTYKQLSHMQTDSYYYPIDAERDLISYVIRGEREHAQATLNRVLLENLEKRTLTQEQIEQFGLLILATLNRIMHQLNMSSDEFWQLHKEPLEAIQKSESSKQTITAIVHLFDLMIDNISQQNEMMDHSTVKRMIEFIHNNYSIDLSLTMIAETFNFSPGYVSIAFKNYAGENFKDYLNVYRVQKAKEIMQREKVKIGDLALMVGCNNTNTFIRMFRKYEGVSPGQYAKNIQQQNH